MTTRSSGNPQHPTCVDITTMGQPPHSEWVCGPDCPPHAKPAVTTYDEWRVTGTWDGADMEFELSPARGITDPESAARVLAAQVPTRGLGWTDGPHLHKRTVTVTEWEAVE